MLSIRTCFSNITLGLALCLSVSVSTQAEEKEDGFTPLFDGKTLTGWSGDETQFRVADGVIVGGNLKEKIPHNFFLSSKDEYADFELRLEFRLLGDDTNAGIQIRSRRIPDHHEMIGYQADLGQNYWVHFMMNRDATRSWHHRRRKTSPKC